MVGLGATSTMMLIGGGLEVGSGIMAGFAEKKKGQAVRKAAEHTAKVMTARADIEDQKAGQERAISQRQMIEKREQGEEVSSRIQAVSAASGAGALDPTITDITAGVDRATEEAVMGAKYMGETRAGEREYSAALDRYAATQEQQAGRFAEEAGDRAFTSSLVGAAGTLAMTGAGVGAYRDKMGLGNIWATTPTPNKFARTYTPVNLD